MPIKEVIPIGYSRNSEFEQHDYSISTETTELGQKGRKTTLNSQCQQFDSIVGGPQPHSLAPSGETPDAFRGGGGGGGGGGGSGGTPASFPGPQWGYPNLIPCPQAGNPNLIPWPPVGGLLPHSLVPSGGTLASFPGPKWGDPSLIPWPQVGLNLGPSDC